ncbi:MAG: NADH-quinone oxidoreductase subunit N [Limisphaerales bacterium]|jgi:NADH-quinone oxidoreductase subunit N|nr:NADH-quinone oxidoreductase subunit N [Verrucomicrobiota bacterium]
MNFAAFQLELGLVALALVLLVLDTLHKKTLNICKGYAIGTIGLGLLLILSFVIKKPVVVPDSMVQLDGMALGFKRMFLALGLGFFIINQNWIERRGDTFITYQVLFLLALVGMMMACSINNLALLFLTMEMVAVPFYVLVGYLNDKDSSLESGVKYLIMAALASAVMVMGIAFVYGVSGTLYLDKLAQFTPPDEMKAAYWLGIMLIIAGLGFKISAFPFHYWAPDVYQGAAAPVTGLLASASKAVGFVLLVRFAISAMPLGTAQVTLFWVVISAASILYGNLCAIPQQNVKRLIAFSGIANAGYMMMAFAVGDATALSAMFYYLIAYTFTIMGAFMAITLVETEVGSSDLDALACLPARAPFAAFLLAAAMVSLAGIPPLAGFIGKFLLLKSVFVQGVASSGALIVLGSIALFGVVVSIYYYFGVVRAIYWPREYAQKHYSQGERIALPKILWVVGLISLVMMVLPGIYPALLLKATQWMAGGLTFLTP